MKRISAVLLLSLIAGKATADFTMTAEHCALYTEQVKAIYQMKAEGYPKSDAMRETARWASDPSGTSLRMDIFPLMKTAFTFVYSSSDTLSPEERIAVQTKHCSTLIGLVIH